MTEVELDEIRCLVLRRLLADHAGQERKVANGCETVVEAEDKLKFAKFDVHGMEFEARVIGTRTWVVDRAGNGIADFNHGELMGTNAKFRALVV